MMNIASLGETYGSGEIRNVGHVLSEYNLADPLTKKMKSNVLDDLLLTQKIHHPVHLWMIHKNNNSFFQKI